MTNVIILHGSTPHASAEKYWYGPLAKELTNRGIDAKVADLPMLGRQSLDSTLTEFNAKNLQMDEGTVLIGHSAGANLILTLLEQTRKPVHAAFLVAGFCLPTAHTEPTLKSTYDWEAIKDNCQEFTFLNSFNDPFDCNDKQGNALFDHLGGTLILRNDGHFLRTKQPLLSLLVTATIKQSL